jgi:two-component system, NarL family, invasion response regulator UvrY
MKILLADDHSAIRQRLRHILLEAYPGSRIEEVSDGEGLIRQTMAQSWDLVIADIHMPAVTGLEALRHIRARHPTLPVLLVSSYHQEDYAHVAIRAGASAYLSKETAQDELISLVQQLTVV